MLGIDPGLATTGYGVVRDCEGEFSLIDCGIIATSASHSLPQRLQLLYRGLRDIVELHRPAEVAVESLFFNKNVRSALVVGQARGVALLAAADSALAVSEYTPLQVKQTITGYGQATKEQVQRMMQVLLRIDFLPQPDDAADGAAIAICHLHHSGLKAVIESRL